MNELEQTTAREGEELSPGDQPRRSKAGRGYPVLHVRFEPELHGRIKKRAVESGMSMQDLIREAVIEYLEGASALPLSQQPRQP